MGEGDHRGMALPSDGVSASASGLAARKGSACATHHCWKAKLNVTLSPGYPRKGYGGAVNLVRIFWEMWRGVS